MNGKKKKTVFLEPPTQLFLAKLTVSYLKSWFVMIFFSKLWQNGTGRRLELEKKKKKVLRTQRRVSSVTRNVCFRPLLKTISQAVAAPSPLLWGKHLSPPPDCFWIIYRTRYCLWPNFYNSTKRSAPCLLRHKTPRIKKEQHKEEGTEGGDDCVSKQMRSVAVHEHTPCRVWRCNASQRLDKNAVSSWDWPVPSKIRFLWWGAKQLRAIMRCAVE